jgi:hypothetical protein
MDGPRRDQWAATRLPLQELLDPVAGLLAVAFEPVEAVDEDEAEAVEVSVPPLEAVHEGPGEVALDVDPVLDGVVHELQVPGVELDPVAVLERLPEREGAVVPLGDAVLGDVDDGVVVAPGGVEQELAEARRVVEEDGDELRLADGHAVAEPGGVGADVGVVGLLEPVGRGRGGGVVAGVVVDADEVVGALDQLDLLRREPRQPVAEEAGHGARVRAVHDGVEEPAVHEVEAALHGPAVLGGVGVGHVPVGHHRDADLPALRRLVLGAVQRHGLGVGEEDVVRHDVGLPRRVAGEARLGDVRRAPPRREQADGVSTLRVRPGLVERRPVLDAVAELAEAHVGEVHVVLAARTYTIRGCLLG